MLKKTRLFLAGVYFTYFKKVFSSDGLTIHVPFELTDYEFRGRFVHGTYEEEESRYLKEYLSPDAKVLELGSCLGYVSCLTNKLLSDNSAHVVLEANPQLIPWIEKNRDENRCEFAIENSIISNDEMNDFYVHHLIVGGSAKRKTPNKIQIKGETFQGLRKKYGIDFDTLIMDIEGGELDLFRNYKEGIAEFDQIFMEVHPFANILTKEEAQECEDTLSSLGFDILVRDGNFQIWQKRKNPLEL
jgi:FkbM family methyltransferase